MENVKEVIKIKIKVSRQILNFLLLLIQSIIKNIDDIFIFVGFITLVVSLFLYVSTFVGLMVLSIILIIIGLALGKNNKK